MLSLGIRSFRREIDQLTNFSRDTSKDDLFLAGGFDCSSEVCIVPGVDFTLTVDEGCVRVHLEGTSVHDLELMKKEILLQ